MVGAQIPHKAHVSSVANAVRFQLNVEFGTLMLNGEVARDRSTAIKCAPKNPWKVQ